MKKKIHIEYYAILREERKVNKETVETEASTAKELYNELRKKYNFSLETGRLQLAINDEFCNWQTSLKAGDHIIFIPPVAGGRNSM